MTQRLVPGAGRSAIVSGLPSGPMTYFALGRRGSFMNRLTHSTDQLSPQTYRLPLKICLSTSYQLGNSCRYAMAADAHDGGRGGHAPRVATWPQRQSQ